MNKYITWILIASLAFASACEDFLEEMPKQDPTRDGFFGPNTSEDAVEQLVNGIYASGLWGTWDRRFYWFTVAPADAFNHTVAYDTEGQEYDNHNFNSGQFNIFRMWNYTYWPIGRANSYLANHDQLVELHGDSWTRLDRFKGECLFHRAYWTFFGVQAFGEIPLVVDEFPEGTPKPNSTYSELYDQIITDCNEIINSNLLPNWMEFDGTSDEGRATRGAAKTLLGKVYLTRATSPAAQSGDFQQAATVLKDVIDNEGYALLTDPELDENGDTLFTAYEKVFLPQWENGPEGIFEYQFGGGTGGSRGRMNGEWVPRGFYSPADNGKLRFEVTDLLINSFEPGDIRRQSYFTGEYYNTAAEEFQTVDKIWMAKFQDPFGNRSNDFENNLPMMRYADVLLMYAEALNEANSGPTAEAYAAINEVRARANVPPLAGLGYAEFQEAIRNERFKEFPGEGWRLWDLRRWGFDYLKQRVELSNPNASVSQNEMLWPVPDYEIGVNPLINQNPGY
jgi:hypothetical protein